VCSLPENPAKSLTSAAAIESLVASTKTAAVPPVRDEAAALETAASAAFAAWGTSACCLGEGG